MPEVEVHRPGRKHIEIEIWAIVDGRIVVGEAKKDDKLERNEDTQRKRCDALKGILSALTADVFPMASASPEWSERTRKVVEDRLSGVVPTRRLNNVG
jgi:hypothetical protein